MRRDGVYWQRLRKDRPSNLASVCAVISTLAAAVSLTMAVVAGGQSEARASPLYWVILLPVAWWASSLVAFEPWAVRIWKPVLGVACLASVMCLYVAMTNANLVTPNAIGAVIVVSFALASMIFYRISLVSKEGPAR